MSLLAAQPLNVAQVAHGLQEYIEKKYEQVYEFEADFLKYWEQEAEEVPTNYRGRRVPLEINPNPSIASGNPNGGILATPGAPANDHITVTYQWLNTGLEVTYEAVMNDRKGGVGNSVRRGIDATAESLAYWLNIYTSNGDGTTKIAKASASYDGTNATTKKTFVAAGATDSIGATQVLVGQRVLVYDPTGATQRTGTVGAGALVVSSVTGTTVVTTTDLPSDYVSGDILVPEGTNTVGIKGVPFIVGTTGDYFGINRTTQRRLQSTVFNVGGALTAAAMLNLYYRLYQKTGTKGNAGRGKIEMFMNITQSFNYANLIGTSTTPQMFVYNGGDRPQYDVGGKSMEFTFWGIPMHTMMRFPGNAIYFLNMKYMRSAVLKKMGQMLDMPSGDWLQALDSSANYLAAKQRWYDVAQDNYSPAPHRHGALTGLTMTNAPLQSS